MTPPKTVEEDIRSSLPVDEVSIENGVQQPTDMEGEEGERQTPQFDLGSAARSNEDRANPRSPLDLLSNLPDKNTVGTLRHGTCPKKPPGH